MTEFERDVIEKLSDFGQRIASMEATLESIINNKSDPKKWLFFGLGIGVGLSSSGAGLIKLLGIM